MSWCSGVAALAAFALVAGVVPAASAPATPPPLRIAGQTRLFGAPDVIALRQGFFRQEGLEVDAGSAPDAGRETESASPVDVQTISVRSFLIGVDSGAPLVAIAVSSHACGATHVAVRADSGIQDVTGLRGKKIALPSSSLTELVFVSRLAPAFGLRPGDYTTTAVRDPKARIPTLVARRVDAAIVTEPAFALAESEGIVRSLATFCKYDPLPYIVAANRQSLKNRSDAVVAYLRGWLRAVKLLREEPLKAAAAYGEGMKALGRDMPTPALDRALRRVKWEGEVTPETERYLAASVQNLQAAHALKSSPDLAKAIDREPFRKALRPR